MAQIIATTDWGDEVYRLEVDGTPDNPKYDRPMWDAVKVAVQREKTAGIR